MCENVWYINFLLPCFLVQLKKIFILVLSFTFEWEESHLSNNHDPTWPWHCFWVNSTFYKIFQLCLQHNFVPQPPCVSSLKILLGNCFRSHVRLVNGQMDRCVLAYRTNAPIEQLLDLKIMMKWKEDNCLLWEANPWFNCAAIFNKCN